PVAGASAPHFIGGALELATIGLRGARLAERAPAWRAPDLVVVAGACGALAPSLAIGALVVPTVVLGPDGTRWPTAPLPRVPGEGALLTVAEVVGDAGEEERLWLESGGVSVEMESAAVMTWARERGGAGADG